MFGSGKRWRRERLRRQWGMDPRESGYESAAGRMDRIRLLHDELEKRSKEQKKPAAGIDEITWQDLEMDDVFRRINHTRSFIGEQVLYHRLHEVKKGQDRERLEEQMQLFTEEEELRIDTELRLSGVGKRDEAYMLPAFLMHARLWRIERTWIFHVLQILLLMFLAAGIILDNGFCLLGLGATALLNLTVWLYTKQRYEGFLAALGRLGQIYGFARWLMREERLWALFGSEELRRDIEELKGLSRLISDYSSRKYAGMSGDVAGILCDYLWGVTLMDVAAFNRIMKVIGNRQEAVQRILQLAGEVDSAIAVASWRAKAPVFCVPEDAADGKIRARGMVHPLLAGAVANDFVLEDRAVITGANASGKSTFMKALAVNVILAQTVNTCSASAFCVPPMHVMTCMSLRDDILSGESYYFREAKYLKRMLDQLEKKEPTLFVLDEILKGTNTRERLAASAAILEYFAASDCPVLAATHDTELAKSRGYRRFYFESCIEGTDVSFDYRIHEGEGGASNAIALLHALHFPDVIVQKARRNCSEDRRMCG